MINKPTKTGRAVIRRNALAVALAIGLGLTGGTTFAQSTTGRIFGHAPATQTVQVTGQSGITRTVTAGADGSYNLRALPVGTYTVRLMENGTAVSTRTVTVSPNAGTEVDFAGGEQNAQELATMQVTASALPAIDISSVTSTTTITAQQLSQLPLGRNAESIALLAPGAVEGSAYFNRAVSFGGAGVTENAYYVNGYNTTALYNYTGSSYQLPYGAIAQQENLTGGYGAKYGRADGGVINQIGKRGTNEWHFGGQVVWQPRSLRSDPSNWYYQNNPLQPGEELQNEDPSEAPGALYRYRKDNKSWETQYSAYIGGPMIQDKLYFFLAAQNTEDKNRSVSSVPLARDTYYKSHDTNYYGKIDWNINDNNILEYTRLSDKARNQYGEYYRYDNETKQDLFKTGDRNYDNYSSKTDIFQYTGYLSDAATLSVIYGDTTVHNPQTLANATQPYISGATLEDPAITGGTPIRNNQSATIVAGDNAESHSKSLRADFDYQLGDHLLEVGIDNLTYTAANQGRQRPGPGKYYIGYRRSADPDAPIRPALDVGAPGGNGYYVFKSIFDSVTNMGAKQKAWYVQDKWQATSNLLLNLGIRNDQFSNQNNVGKDFVLEKNQWEPRVGFSWDVMGDSSLKVYGNAGRYYLALPQSVAERAATASTFTNEYFTYTGIDSEGNPTGLKPVPTVDGDPAGPGPVSSNNEYGQVPDRHQVTATNLKPQYQDEFIVGFDKTLGANWAYGAKLSYRTLGTMIDDVCDYDAIGAKIASMGLNPDNYAYNDPGCRLFNPNRDNEYIVGGLNGADDIRVTMSPADYGDMPDVQRDYYALDLYLSHPFDGTWTGRVDYTFSRSWGDTEGQVRSDLGQTDTSKTEDWDYWQLMSGARGYLANHRRHQLKAYGAWQIAPEWLVSGNLLVQSGSPETCLGLFGPDQTEPTGYGADYHWCRGKIATPGERTNPWQKRLDLGVQYRPMFADQKLAFKLDVFNVTDSQTVTQREPHLHPGADPLTISNDYRTPISMTSPRYVRLSVSYDY